jgi:hypothetical protein
MWRVIVGALTAVFITIGQAWALPTDVSTAGALTCPGGCQAGSVLFTSRDVPGDQSNAEGAAFQDHYSFNLTGPVDMSGLLLAVDALPTLNIENLSVELFDGAMASLGSFAVPNGSGGVFQTLFSVPSLATGAYTFLISGIIPTEFAGGQYVLQAELTQSAVSAVPLPPAMLLFVSALIGMFSLTQMRKRSPTA